MLLDVREPTKGESLQWGKATPREANIVTTCLFKTSLFSRFSQNLARPVELCSTEEARLSERDSFMTTYPMVMRH